MLKNPIHLFRKDGEKVSNILFTARVFQRSEAITQTLNRGVAYRHLLLNQAINVVPHECLELYSRQFFGHHWLVFRPEEVSPPPVRAKVLSPEIRAGNVVRTAIHRSLQYQVNQLVYSHCAPQTDILFYPTDTVYFAGPQVIQAHLVQALRQAGIFIGSNEGYQLDGEFPVVEMSYERVADLEQAKLTLQRDLADKNSVLWVFSQ